MKTNTDINLCYSKMLFMNRFTDDEYKLSNGKVDINDDDFVNYILQLYSEITGIYQLNISDLDDSDLLDYILNNYVISHSPSIVINGIKPEMIKTEQERMKRK